MTSQPPPQPPRGEDDNRRRATSCPALLDLAKIACVKRTHERKQLRTHRALRKGERRPSDTQRTLARLMDIRERLARLKEDITRRVEEEERRMAAPHAVPACLSCRLNGPSTRCSHCYALS